MNTLPELPVLLDQGLPRDTAEKLRRSGVDCTHVGEIGMAASADTDILEHARAAGRIVVTLDADFHAILVLSGMAAPSVIRIRMEGLKGPAIAAIVREVLAVYVSDLTIGCMITVKEQKTTCHLLRHSD